MQIGDCVMVATGPYALKHGVIEEIPAGLEHPLVQVRFFSRAGKLMTSKVDLVNERRLCNFGKTQKCLTARQQARLAKA